MSRPARPLAERFWKKVSTTPNERGCLLWTGYVDPEGRGRINSGGWRGKPLVAARVAYGLKHGPIPPGQCVCHRCDEPRCCNAEHLFLGSQLENIADREAKGRARQGRVEKRSGQAHGMARLTWEQVCEIRKRYAAGGVLHRELAREFGVHRTTISLVLNGKNWTGPGDPS